MDMKAKLRNLLSIALVLTIVLTFAACSPQNSGNGDEKDSTAPEQTLSQPVDEEEKTSQKPTDDSEDKTKPDKTNSTQGSTKKPTSSKKDDTTKKTTTTTEPTTVERKIKLKVIYPAYNSEKAEVNIEYKTKKDKKYTSIFKKKIKEDGKEKTVIEKPTIKLDKIKTKTYKIDKKLGGDVKFRITLDGIDLLENEFVLSGNEKEMTIELVASTEIVDGGWD